MKFITRLLSAAIVCFAVSASAQLTWVGPTATSYTGGTNKAMAVTTNAFFTIDVPRSTDLALYCNYSFLNAPGAGDANSISIDFFRGLAPGAYETNAWFTWVVAGNSTTPRAEATNITVAGIPYLRARIKNFSTNSHATNILVQYGSKNWR